MQADEIRIDIADEGVTIMKAQFTKIHMYRSDRLADPMARTFSGMSIHNLIFQSSVRFLFMVLLLLLTGPAAMSVFAQQMILQTDKTEYEYGETIEVRVSIFNDTDSTLHYSADGGYGGTYVGINSVQFLTVWDLLEWEYQLLPGYTYSWIWKFEPAMHGVPDKEGEQIIYGQIDGWFRNASLPKRRDSLIIQAPKYYGGVLSIGFEPETSEEARQAIRDSLDVVVLDDWREGENQRWQIEGLCIDSLATRYESDPRFRWFEPHRPLQLGGIAVSSFPEQTELAATPMLHQNYPNPFNPSTRIRYSLPESAHVTVEVFDIAGRHVATLVDRLMPPGEHATDFDAGGLSSGIYVYRISASGHTLTRRMTLIR